MSTKSRPKASSGKKTLLEKGGAKKSSGARREKKKGTEGERRKKRQEFQRYRKKGKEGSGAVFEGPEKNQEENGKKKQRTPEGGGWGLGGKGRIRFALLMILREQKKGKRRLDKQRREPIGGKENGGPYASSTAGVSPIGYEE